MKKYVLITHLFITLILIIPSTGLPEKSGTPVPDIALRNINGELIIMKNILKEKPVLLSFFFTDCKPCEKEIPELDILNSRYNGNVRIFLVSTDREGADKVSLYIKERNIKTDVLLDKFSDAARKFGVIEYPSVFLIDRNGKIIFSKKGYHKDTITEIESAIKKLKQNR